MKASASPSWIEIPVSDMDRAEQFYSAVFGCSTERFTGGSTLHSMLLDETGKPTTFCLVQGPNFSPSGNSTILYYNVGQNIKACFEAINTAGGQTNGNIEFYGEGIGHCAFFTDSEGNNVALHNPLTA